MFFQDVGGVTQSRLNDVTKWKLISDRLTLIRLKFEGVGFVLPFRSMERTILKYYTFLEEEDENPCRDPERRFRLSDGELGCASWKRRREE